MLRVIATDQDIGPNAMLSYYITAGNQDLTFRMDRVTGEMVTRPAPPDRERQQEYRLTVTVEDDGTPPLSVRYRQQQPKRSLSNLIHPFSQSKMQKPLQRDDFLLAKRGHLGDSASHLLKEPFFRGCCTIWKMYLFLGGCISVTCLFLYLP